MNKILPVSGALILLYLFGTASEVFSIAVNFRSNLIILSGTFLCCIVSYSGKQFFTLAKSIQNAFTKKHRHVDEIIDEIEALSALRRSQGILKLDEKSRQIQNSFLRSGIEMVVDGYDRHTIFMTMERGYDNYLGERRSEADFVNTIIKLLPVFGFAGTIIGLINVLNHMGSPELIGKGVATALLTTFYGLLYANVIFLPISKKLAEKTKQDSVEMALIIEGVLDISDKVNSKFIRYRLKHCMGNFYQDNDSHYESSSHMVSKQKFASLGLALNRQETR